MKTQSVGVQRALFAYALAQVRFGYVLAHHLPLEQLKRIFLLLAKLVREELVLEGYDKKGIQADLKRIRKVMGRKIRNKIKAPIGEMLRNIRKIEFQSWKEGMIEGGLRISLLMTQDIRLVFEALPLILRDERLPKLSDADSFIRTLQDNSLALDLFKFSHSLEYFQVREQFGIARSGIIV